MYTVQKTFLFLYTYNAYMSENIGKKWRFSTFLGLIFTRFKNALRCCIFRYKRKTQSVHVYNSTTPTWLNFTLLKENLDEWSQVNDFGLRSNVIKMNSYNTRALFLSHLTELENSLSNVAELITTPSSLDRGSAESSIIQFKVTENVMMQLPIDSNMWYNLIRSYYLSICRWGRLTNSSSKLPFWVGCTSMNLLLGRSYYFWLDTTSMVTEKKIRT